VAQLSTLYLQVRPSTALNHSSVPTIFPEWKDAIHGHLARGNSHLIFLL